MPPEPLAVSRAAERCGLAAGFTTRIDLPLVECTSLVACRPLTEALRTGRAACFARTLLNALSSSSLRIECQPSIPRLRARVASSFLDRAESGSRLIHDDSSTPGRETGALR